MIVKPPRSVRRLAEATTHGRALLAVLAALAAAPGLAAAATVEVGPEGIVYRAAPHEVNDVTMRDAGPAPPRRSVVEASARLTLGQGCDPGAPILCSNLSLHKDVLLLGDRDDRANYFSNFADSYVYGGSGDDTVASGGDTAFGYGGAGDDYVAVGSNGGSYGWGGVGNDVVEGGGKADFLHGGRGNDILRSTGPSPGNLYGGPGNDRLENPGGHGLASARGGAGNDTMIVFPSLSDQNEFRGGPGNDLMSIGGNQFRLDRIVAGPGNDQVLAANAHPDTIECGAGRDRVEADQLDTVARSCELVTIRVVEPPQ